MKRVSGRRSLFTGLVMLVALFVAASWYGGQREAMGAGAEDRATGKAVVITSPADGEVISGTSVDVIFELRNKGSRGHHVHLYLDGKFVKALYGAKVVYTLDRLSLGNHNITIRLATKGHKVLKPQDSITVELK